MAAPAVLQSFLDEIGDALMADDWPTYRPCVHLPCHIVSFEGNTVVTTEAELRDGFNEFRDKLRFHRVTDYIRLVEHAAQLEHDMISGSYLSHLICNGHRLMDPSRSQITLRLIDGRWRAASVTNGLANSRWSFARQTLSPETDPKGPLQ